MDCNGYNLPIQLPFQNVSLPAVGPQAQLRGIPLALGTPPQQLSLQPRVLSNHSIFIANTYCPALGDIACNASIGGPFHPIDSSSLVYTTFPEWNDTDHDPTSFDNYMFADIVTGSIQTYCQDKLHVTENTTLPGFPAILVTDVDEYNCEAQAFLLFLALVILMLIICFR